MSTISKREDKKALILDKAVSIFAEKGYYKTTTAEIAQAAGVTQPYIFHFFKNKEELFISVIDGAFLRIYDTFKDAKAPKDRLIETMGTAFMQIMQTYKDETILVMQAHAISEPIIRDHVRKKFQDIHSMVLKKFQEADHPNAAAAAAHFIAMGLLITLSEVIELPDLLCFDDK